MLLSFQHLVYFSKLLVFVQEPIDLLILNVTLIPQFAYCVLKLSSKLIVLASELIDLLTQLLNLYFSHVCFVLDFELLFLQELVRCLLILKLSLARKQLLLDDIYQSTRAPSRITLSGAFWRKA